MSLRLKILLGFVILAAMLFISGAIFIYELTKQNQTVRKMISDSYRSIDYSKRMLDELEKQEKILLIFIGNKNSNLRESFVESTSLFELNLDSAKLNLTFSGEAEMVDSTSIHYSSFKKSALMVFKQESFDLKMYLDSIHLNQMRTTEYIKKLMMINQQQFSSSAALYEINSQNAIYTGFVVILTSLIFTFIFTYLVNHFFISPIIRLTNGINDYVRFQKPFNVPLETRDELYSLKESIKSLISFNRSPKT